MKASITRLSTLCGLVVPQVASGGFGYYYECLGLWRLASPDNLHFE